MFVAQTTQHDGHVNDRSTSKVEEFVHVLYGVDN